MSARRPLLFDALRDLTYSGRWHLRSWLRPASTKRYRGGDDRFPTIVPIAGIFERWDFLIPVLDRLHDAGHPICPLPALRRNFGGVRDLAEQVLDELVARDIDEVILLGHSKGGMVAKAALVVADERRAAGTFPMKVHGAVAIAAPFAGTRLVDVFADSTELGMFRPQSEVTRALEACDAVDPRIISIFPEADEIVSEPGLIECGRNIVVPIGGHGRVLGDWRTKRAVLRAAWILSVEGGNTCVPEPPRLRRTRETSFVGGEDDEMRWRRRHALDPRDWPLRVLDYLWAAQAQLMSLRLSDATIRRWASGLPDGATVVLVPGVFERAGFLCSLAEHLHCCGHSVHIVSSLGWNRASLGESARRLERELALRGIRDVIVIAHSKGGLIAKAAMLRPQGDRIRHLIAIATPFAGSKYAQLFADPALRLFTPGHPELRNLARERHVNARVTTVQPEFDPHIPEDAESFAVGTLPGAHERIVLPVSGHFRLLDDPRLLDVVARVVRAHWHSRHDSGTQ